MNKHWAIIFHATLFIHLGFPFLAQAKDVKTWNYYGAIEYYATDKAEEDVDSAINNVVNPIYSALGVPAQGSVETRSGQGIRLGMRRDYRKWLEIGGSFGYVVGPRIDVVIKDTMFGSELSRVILKSRHIRLMAEPAIKMNISKRVQMILAAGVGYSNSRISGMSDLPVIGDGSDQQKVNSFSWEVSPGIRWHTTKLDFEFGVRMSEFPSFKNIRNGIDVNWSPLSVFLGLQF